MRFMVLVKANADTEAGVMPSEELLTAMGQYNEELVKAGVLLAGEGLLPSSAGEGAINTPALLLRSKITCRPCRDINPITIGACRFTLALPLSACVTTNATAASSCSKSAATHASLIG